MHKVNHHIELCSKIIVLCLLNIVLTTGIVLSSNTTTAVSSTSTASVTVPEACTMTSTNNTPHTATLSPNTYSGASGSDYQNGIGKTTLSVVCNDYNGFSIYAIGFTGNSYDSENHTKLVGNTTGNTISTKVYASTDTSSNWSMKVTKVTDSSVSYNPTNMSIQNSFDDWHEVPDTYTKVAQYKANTGSSTTDTTLGVKLETTYAAFIASNQPADTYVGQVKYTMVHPYDAATPIIPKSIATATTMQEVNSCPVDLPKEQVYTLTDTRDSQTYKVAKLKDGKCWMVENLNIAGGTALSSADTNFDASYTLPTTDGWTVTDGKLVLPASAVKNDNNNDLTEPSQFGQNNKAYVFNSNNKDNCGRDQYVPCYSYYSWDAATVGSGRNLDTDAADAQYSICPKGWKLPTSGSNLNDGWKRGDYYTLSTAYGAVLENYYYNNSNLFYNNAGPSAISDFLTAGYYNYSSFNSGTYGFVWSSTSYRNNTSANHLYFYSSWVSVANSYERRFGLSVRCLLAD